MSQPTHQTIRVIAEVGLETFGTAAQCRKEFNLKFKVVKAVAKALGLTLWIDELVIEE